MAATVEMYTWRFCPFCIRAKALLDRKGVAYSEYVIDGDEAAPSSAPASSMPCWRAERWPPSCS